MEGAFTKVFNLNPEIKKEEEFKFMKNMNFDEVTDVSNIFSYNFST